ncbi:peptidylprolyl isomerase [Candidatus Pacearchaeota archaeon]|nr:peptidylprolyl isomerase [Candidatus Pacearchaeota archaeon]
MAIETFTVQLERVQAAIAKIETGAQEYGIGNRRAKRAQLSDLYARERELRAEVKREGNSGNIVVKRAIPQ